MTEPDEYDKVDILDCDDRGRATLGIEFAHSRVKVYVEEIEGGGEE